MAGEARREEIREVRNKYSWFYALIIGAGTLAVGIWIGASAFADKDGYAMNVVTELLGIGATVFIIDKIYTYRNNENLKRLLVQKARSPANAIAIDAIEELRTRGWLKGDKGVLKGEFLLRANLKNTDLSGANLQDVYMSRAKLKGATLIGTDLSGAHLDQADLRQLASTRANLNGAFLGGAKLQFAQLWDADLRGASLAGAYLHCAQFNGANLKDATLPDGTVVATEEYDMDRFTDWDHPEFDSTLKKIESIRIQFTHG